LLINTKNANGKYTLLEDGVSLKKNFGSKNCSKRGGEKIEFTYSDFNGRTFRSLASLHQLSFPGRVFWPYRYGTVHMDDSGSAVPNYNANKIFLST
jgi:hypothetical protein